ncbi:hypothetical protein [Nannocystis pusilla]|uniref:hypothetical protein n=1 Tax=Nannocystis pusilla TaxID=889268 RepID=UPI003DA298F7
MRSDTPVAVGTATVVPAASTLESETLDVCEYESDMISRSTSPPGSHTFTRTPLSCRLKTMRPSGRKSMPPHSHAWRPDAKVRWRSPVATSTRLSR